MLHSSVVAFCAISAVISTMFVNASQFRGHAPVVDGKCNVTAQSNMTKFLEDGESLVMGRPHCARITCNVKAEEVIGEACWAISCDNECRPVAKNLSGVFPDCCFSECDCRDTYFIIDPVSA